MDGLLFVVMFGLIIFIGIKNFSLLKRYKHNKTYIEAYQKVLHNEEDSYAAISDYVKTEKSAEFINKARIIKLYSALENNEDYKETLAELDLSAIFYKKGAIDHNLVKLNSDSFIFLVLVMSKAYATNHIKVIEALQNKLREVGTLVKYLEYAETFAVGEILSNKSNDVTFFSGMIDGNYTSYQYEKNLIGLYKRIAASMLAFKNAQFDEFFRNDLHNFAKSMIGSNLLKNLGLYETYKPFEEPTPEPQIEESKEENKE